jgi:hypothetical protein
MYCHFISSRLRVKDNIIIYYAPPAKPVELFLLVPYHRTEVLLLLMVFPHTVFLTEHPVEYLAGA